jgi:hypothetical protein
MRTWYGSRIHDTTLAELVAVLNRPVVSGGYARSSESVADDQRRIRILMMSQPGSISNAIARTRSPSMRRDTPAPPNGMHRAKHGLFYLLGGNASGPELWLES